MKPGRWLLLVASLALPAGVAAGQQPPAGRPPLPAEADTNDWQAYYARGFKLMTENVAAAREAFRWASRISPERGEPLFALWVTLRLGTFITPRERAGIDSMRLMSMVRNPYVHRALEIYVYQVNPAILEDKDLKAGVRAYAESNFTRAVEYLGRAIRKEPSKNLWFHSIRAQAFVGLLQYDSALADMAVLRDSLEQEQATETVLVYQTKAFIYYAIGMLEQVRGREAEARESMSRALVENLGFYPAHMFLGDAALDAARNEDAVREYEAALMTAPNDVVLYFHYGRALANMNREDDAIAALRKAIAIEPYYAAPWLFLARLLDVSGDRLGAAAFYRGFMARSPRSDPNLPLARKWLAGLQASPR